MTTGKRPTGSSDTPLEPDTTVRIPPSQLRLFQKNPRKGNVGAVAASLQAHDQYRPIVANIGTHTGRKLEVLAGNHTVKAFRALAQKHPDDQRWSGILVHLVDVDEDQAKRIVLADNKTSEEGSYDNTELAGLLGDLQDSLDGFGATGFSFSDLDGLIPDDDPEVDPEALVDYDELPPEPSGRGAPVISYAIVFDTAEQKATWVAFVNWLKRQHPDLTAAERISAYLEDLAQTQGEAEPDAL